MASAGGSERDADHTRQSANDEAALITSCQKGNVSAYETLYRRHAPTALRVAALIIGDRGLAEDCLQEAAIRAWYAIRRFTVGRPFYPWFLKFTVNEALKSRQRKLWHFAQLPASLEEPARADVGEHAEMRDAVTRAIAELDLVHRTVVVLFYYSDLSELQIAALLGIRASTVKSRLHTARQRLAAKLRQEEFSDGQQLT